MNTGACCLLAALALSAGAAACSSNPSSPSPASGGSTGSSSDTATTGSAERGEYLVDHVFVCGVCHTPSLSDGNPDPSKYLAGSRSYDFTDVDGTIVTVNAENLTSHDTAGPSEPSGA